MKFRLANYSFLTLRAEFANINVYEGCPSRIPRGFSNTKCSAHLAIAQDE